MPNRRFRLYLVMLIACLAGYGWLAFARFWPAAGPPLPDVCLFKHITGVPCPSCGTTRSIVALSHGEFLTAFLINPLGYLSSAILLIAPVWILFDLVAGKDSFYRFYLAVERRLVKKQVAIPLILLVVAIWIWNVLK